MVRPKTRPRKAPRQARAEDTVEVLVQATERVLGLRGFHRATTNEIAAVAGVGIGTLYRYFPTKEALVECVVHRMWQGELDLLLSHVPLLETKPLREIVAIVVRALCTHIRERRALYAAWHAEASHLGAYGTGEEMIVQAAALLERELRRIGSRHPDPGFAARLIIRVLVEGARNAAAREADALESGAVADALVSLVDRFLFV